MKSLYEIRQAEGRNTAPVGCELDVLRAAFFMLLAFGHDGGAEASAEVVGQFVKLGIAINLNGLLRSIANYVAVVAPGKMIFQLDFCGFVEHAV
jgi:hypothetical protein